MKVLGIEVPPAVAEREPVLEVPAVDMTDQSQPENASPQDVANADVAKPTRQRRKPRARTKKTSPKATMRTTGTRDRSVGRETYAAVEALVKDGSSKTDAFRSVAEKSNRMAGTVAATYYRMARSEGAAKPRRSEAKTTTPAALKRRSAGRGAARASADNMGQDIDRLAASLVESVDALASVVKAQSQEVADLRRRLDGVRSLLN